MSFAVFAGPGVWTSSGPEGGIVSAVYRHPTNSALLFARTNAGFYRSIDAGTSWAQIDNNRVIPNYGDITFDPEANRLYRFKANNELIFSIDQGLSWQASGYQLPTIAASYNRVGLADIPGSTDLLLTLAPSAVDAALPGPLVYRSSDLGVTFTALPSVGLPPGEPMGQVMSLDSGGNTLLVATAGASFAAGVHRPALYRSTDAGNTWTSTLTLVGAPALSDDTYVFRGAGGRLFALVAGTIHISDSGGATWTALSAAGGSVAIKSRTFIAPDPLLNTRFYAGGGFGPGTVSPGGFAQCDISGSNYTCVGALRLSPNLSYTQLNGSESLPGVVTSIDVEPDFGAGGSVWVSTGGNGVYQLSKPGGVWSAIGRNTGLSATQIRAVLVHPNPSTISGGQHRRLYAGFGDNFSDSPGAFLTTDGGNTWNASNNGLRMTNVRDLVIDLTTAGIGQPAGSVPISNSTLFATGQYAFLFGSSGQQNSPYGGSSILRSTNGGGLWEPIGGGLPTTNAIIGGTPFPYPYVRTVRQLTLDPRSCASPPPVGPCMSGPLTVAYASTSGFLNSTVVGPNNRRNQTHRLVKSTNVSSATSAASVTWTDIGTPGSGFAESYTDDLITVFVTPLSIVIDPNDSNTLYVGTFGSAFVNVPPAIADPHSGVFKSSDGGVSWTKVSNGLPLRPGQSNQHYDVLALVNHPTDSNTLWATVIDLQTEGAGLVGSPIYKTTNGGMTWSPSSSGIPASFDVRALLVDPGSPNILYASGYSLDTTVNPGAVFRSSDGGATWSSISIGLPAGAALALELDPVNSAVIHAGTSQGVWSLTQVPDADGDGAPDATENGIQGGDGNGDGMQDSVQRDVGSTGVALRGLGGSNVTVDVVSSVSASNPNNPCVQNVDVTGQLALQYGRDYLADSSLYYSYPDEVVQFEIVDCDSAVVDVTYHSENFNEFGWSFRFFGPRTPGDANTVRWHDFSERAVKLNSKTWRLNLDRDAFGAYRPPAANSIRFIGGPACFDSRILVDGFEDTPPTVQLCN